VLNQGAPALPSPTGEDERGDHDGLGTEARMKVIVVGAGNVGSSLARLFASRRAEVCLWSRSAVPADRQGLVMQAGRVRVVEGGANPGGEAPDLVVLAVPDAAIPEAARLPDAWGVAVTVPVVHTSGSYVGERPALGERPFGRMHPAFSFPGPDVELTEMADMQFVLTGDVAAVEGARAGLEKMGLFSVRPAALDLRLYHAACVMASNFTGAVGVVAGSLLAKAGLRGEDAERVMQPLMRSVVMNARRVGFLHALTGPVMRNDKEVVCGEADEVLKQAPELLPFFLEGNRTLAVVAKRPRMIEAIVQWARKRMG